MIDIFKVIFGDKNERTLRKYQPIVDEINQHYEQLQDVSDEELRAKTQGFKQAIRDAVADIEKRREDIRITLRDASDAEVIGGDGQAAPDGQDKPALSLRERQGLYDELDQLEQDWLSAVEGTLDDLLPEAFAVVKETCRRFVGKEWMAGGSLVKWDMIPYDVQLIGGIALHEGKIAEMKTGEGKTLVAVAPVYLNALAGRGVHLVTVNPYLAQRDMEWMKPIFEFHGLTADVIDAYEPHSEARRSAYRADITYGTNNEFGFDYLRDNSFVTEPEQLVQRGHHYAIVDEVDSVLIDEARTPLIISGPVPQANDDRFAELKPGVEKLVYAQQKLVAHLASEAEQKLKERDEAEAAGDKRRARDAEEEAGLALLRAQHGFPRNKKLQKLLMEPGIGVLTQRTESFYLQDNAKNMPFVDEELYFALNEKMHSIEMTDKGRDFASSVAGEDKDLFILPDLGDGVAHIEKEFADKRKQLDENLRADESMTEEKRQHKLENDIRLLEKEKEEAKRTLYTLYSERAERLHAIEQLLRAYTLYEKDVEYIVQEDKVLIVDEHTGRVLPGRRYSDGLHQAIEAKESVQVQAATQTYATITLQNYFRLYDKLAGMTGTAETEAEEFFKIYKLDVVVVPTNKPIAREDLDDLVYKTKREKFSAVLAKIKEYHEKGQPVLVGTTSVETSETLSRMLQRQGIKHNVLNARRDRAKAEALTIAEAGHKGAVTIATNMAGRGTDIKLGPGIVDLGGLAILGTERHESRRIDLQLRGRSGRQGDPGESQFYVSLEDDLMRLFGSDRTVRVMDRLGMEEGAVITHPWINKSIERAQKKVEQNHFATRKRQLEYDDVLNAQREVIYDRRMHALKGDRLRGDILETIQGSVERIVKKHYGDGNLEEMREELMRVLAFDFEIDRERFARLGEDGVAEAAFEAAVDVYTGKREALARPFHDSIRQILESDAETKPDRAVVDFTDGHRFIRVTVKMEDALRTKGHEVNDAMERVAVLSIIDEHWTEHLRELDELKEGIHLRAYGQRDPLVEYKMEAYKLFAEMMEENSADVASLVMKAGPIVNGQQARRPAAPPRRRLDPNRARETHASADPSYGVNAGNGAQANAADRDPTAKPQPVLVGEKVGRNDPCPCGSGKKYKNCHGRNAA
ncbi:MAG TPA: preprotein translocase subunit SecA [Rhodothermales bacterium]|nr:preprotein translocase subunit SecA [Rhodothermales bacterium]